MDSETFAIVKEIFEEKIAFNKLLSMSVDSINAAEVKISIPVQPQLIGNYARKMLHGGVISSVIDVAGGVAALVGIVERLEGASQEELGLALTKLGTIDMRIDFLRPGTGEHFTCTAYPLRHGRKVAVVRSEFHNEKKELIAVGTGSYVTS